MGYGNDSRQNGPFVPQYLSRHGFARNDSASKSRFRPIIEALEQNLFVLILSNEILLEFEEVLKKLGGARAWPAFRAPLPPCRTTPFS